MAPCRPDVFHPETDPARVLRFHIIQAHSYKYIDAKADPLYNLSGKGWICQASSKAMMPLFLWTVARMLHELG